MQVPFLDLKISHLDLEPQLVSVFQTCLRNTAFVGGPAVQMFEEEFAHFCETKFCVAVNSGTDALRFALIAAGIGPGDEVITVPNTFIATSEAISQTGAKPVFVDVDERTYNMDPNSLEDYLKICKWKSTGNRRPKAVIPVHLYGQPAEMDSIQSIAERFGLLVIEDACQAHGSLYFSEKAKKWKKAGSMGKAAAFSFYPGKNLGACGEGGAVTTSDPDIAKKVLMLRDHGQAQKYHHELEGYNGRLDALQAGILRVKLRHLPEWNERRRRNAALYDQLFAPVDAVVPPWQPPWAKAVYHLYVIRTPRRNVLQMYLGEKKIGTGLHYPTPLHLQKAYSMNGYQSGMFPVSEKTASEILSLPMYPELTKEQISYVVDTVSSFYEGSKI